MKIQKKNRGSGWGVVGGVRVDVNEELKFLGSSQKKSEGGREGGQGIGLVGVRVDVNAMLGVGVMWGMDI